MNKPLIDLADTQNVDEILFLDNDFNIVPENRATIVRVQTGRKIDFFYTKNTMMEKIINVLRTHGGAGSGNFGHKGRPGKVGGSAPRGPFGQLFLPGMKPSRPYTTGPLPSYQDKFPSRPESEELSNIESLEKWKERTIEKTDEELLLRPFGERDDYQEGVFYSQRVEVKDDGRAIQKTNDSPRGRGGWGDFNLYEGFAKREVLAYKVDEMLGLGVVPRTEGLETDSGYQSLQAWVNNADMGEDTNISYEDLADPSELGKISILDALSANGDRHQQNWLVTEDNHLVAIDNGLGYMKVRDYADTSLHRSFNDYIGLPARDYYYVPKEYKSNLDIALSSGMYVATLKEYIGYSTPAEKAMVDAAMKRARDLSENWDSFYTDDPKKVYYEYRWGTE